MTAEPKVRSGGGFASTKTEWRRRANADRKRNLARREELDAGIRHALRQWFLIASRPGLTVVSFSAMEGEPDLGPLVDDEPLAALGLTFGVTRTPDEGWDLTVHPASSELETHRFGYRQPVVSSPVIPDPMIDVVLVPGLAFDRRGNRLGFGAGYFDRFLARIPGVIRVGITDGPVDGVLPSEAHDIPMTHLATPGEVIDVVR